MSIMPRKPKKLLGTRAYRNYTPNTLQECLVKVRSGQLTQRVAAERYNISRSTIKSKLKGLHDKPVGRSHVTESLASSSKSHPPLNRKRLPSDSSTEVLSENDLDIESDQESETFSDLEEISDAAPVILPKLKPEDYAVEDFVLILFNGGKYPGKIVSISEEGPTVDCMERGLKFWRWPERKDSMEYEWEDIHCKIDPPKMSYFARVSWDRSLSLHRRSLELECHWLATLSAENAGVTTGVSPGDRFLVSVDLGTGFSNLHSPGRYKVLPKSISLGVIPVASFFRHRRLKRIIGRCWSHSRGGSSEWSRVRRPTYALVHVLLRNWGPLSDRMCLGYPQRGNTCCSRVRMIWWNSDEGDMVPLGPVPLPPTVGEVVEAVEVQYLDGSLPSDKCIAYNCGHSVALPSGGLSMCSLVSPVLYLFPSVFLVVLSGQGIGESVILPWAVFQGKLELLQKYGPSCELCSLSITALFSVNQGCPKISDSRSSSETRQVMLRVSDCMVTVSWTWPWAVKVIPTLARWMGLENEIRKGFHHFGLLLFFPIEFGLESCKDGWTSEVAGQEFLEFLPCGYVLSVYFPPVCSCILELLLGAGQPFYWIDLCRPKLAFATLGEVAWVLMSSAVEHRECYGKVRVVVPLLMGSVAASEWGTPEEEALQVSGFVCPPQASVVVGFPQSSQVISWPFSPVQAPPWVPELTVADCVILRWPVVYLSTRLEIVELLRHWCRVEGRLEVLQDLLDLVVGHHVGVGGEECGLVGQEGLIPGIWQPVWLVCRLGSVWALEWSIPLAKCWVPVGQGWYRRWTCSARSVVSFVGLSRYVYWYFTVGEATTNEYWSCWPGTDDLRPFGCCPTQSYQLDSYAKLGCLWPVASGQCGRAKIPSSVQWWWTLCVVMVSRRQTLTTRYCFAAGSALRPWHR
uniref:HTH psq-type domain-containing protein n=1 Tax=Timema shepardi TaxID=629360 RepID=A0A7R9G3U2_TIMSH|nr:unnamed protein product [Timema shepardi]